MHRAIYSMTDLSPLIGRILLLILLASVSTIAAHFIQIPLLVVVLAWVRLRGIAAIVTIVRVIVVSYRVEKSSQVRGIDTNRKFP